ncbi:MAG: STAS-like domain-containing protein [Xanthobacteraceae bacterium]|jgi:hypothetical protein
MMNERIFIATDFSKYPGPRYRHDGPYSGEEFREQLLVPALRRAHEHHEVLTVVLDGVAGYGSSFLEEAFGGLLREGFTSDFLERNLAIVAQTPRFQHHRLRALSYMKEAARLQVA